MLTLINSEKSGQTLQTAVDNTVAQAGGWSECIARKRLDLIKEVLGRQAPMGAAMRNAYNRSSEVAQKSTTFAKDHPVICTLIALGVLVILAPAAISALGFTAEGVAEGEFRAIIDANLTFELIDRLIGSYAAAWQSTYGGFVEAGSWFSYFQKLGTVVGAAKL